MVRGECSSNSGAVPTLSGPGPKPPDPPLSPFPSYGLSLGLRGQDWVGEGGGLGRFVGRHSQGQTIPQTLASPPPPPLICTNSSLGTREILGIRAGEEPAEISWSNPLVLQIIIILITLDGGNSQRASTSGLPLCAPEPLGLAELMW